MTKNLTPRVLPKGRGNHSTGEQRSINARKGRGADAFATKLTINWVRTLERVEQIAARQRALGDIPVSFPLHVPIETVRGVKL